jgi:hypothetical protein
MADHSEDDAVMVDLDDWLPGATLRLHHERTTARASAEAVWDAANAVTVAETGLLGGLIRWRIPGTPRGQSFGELFTQPPFVVLQRTEQGLVSGLVGRIWTLRRDYPLLTGPAQFRAWDQSGTARVCFAHWVDRREQTVLVSEARVEPIGLQGRLGVGAVGPLVRRFGSLVGSEGLAAAIRRAEQGP